MAPARDGARVPISIVHRKDFVRDGRAPLYLYGYGAYGVAMSPGFSSARLSLLDRGFVYRDRARPRRRRTGLWRGTKPASSTDARTPFNDFVDAARFLIANSTTRARGGSSHRRWQRRRQLTGAVANEAPELWGAVVSHVPFVDVLNTMLDETLPLTQIEWPEWGNPIADKAAFELIRSYSPYDQLERQAYPPMLVTAGLERSARYVLGSRRNTSRSCARSRPTTIRWCSRPTWAPATRASPGGYDSLREVAEEYAFVLTADRNA